MSGPLPTTFDPPLSLGDILGSVLARQEAELIREQEERIAAEAQLCSAWQIASELATMLSVDPDEVFNSLTRVPDEMLGLLQSPEGWAALAWFVAGDLGKAPVNYLPTRH